LIKKGSPKNPTVQSVIFGGEILSSHNIMTNHIIYKSFNYKNLATDYARLKYPSLLSDERCIENPYSVNEIFLFLQNLNRRRNL